MHSGGQGKGVLTRSAEFLTLISLWTVYTPSRSSCVEVRMSRFTSPLVALALLSASPVLAHHNYSAFDRTQRVTIEGTLEELVYGNPHILMKVRAGSDLYVASWETPRQVSRQANFTATTFHVGDRIVVTGSPKRDGTSHELALLSEVVRPVDGWRWTKAQTQTESQTQASPSK
jgi:hypothetical protein